MEKETDSNSHTVAICFLFCASSHFSLFVCICWLREGKQFDIHSEWYCMADQIESNRSESHRLHTLPQANIRFPEPYVSLTLPFNVGPSVSVLWLWHKPAITDEAAVVPNLPHRRVLFCFDYKLLPFLMLFCTVRTAKKTFFICLFRSYLSGHQEMCFVCLPAGASALHLSLFIF